MSDQSNKPKGRIEYHGDVIHAPDAGKVGVDMKTRTTKRLDEPGLERCAHGVADQQCYKCYPDTPSPAAPREWWISKCKHVGVPTYVSDEIEFRLRKQHNEIQECCITTHVIEYSAYEAVVKSQDMDRKEIQYHLEQRRELHDRSTRLEAELAKVKQERNSAEMLLRATKHQRDENKKLQAENAELQSRLDHTCDYKKLSDQALAEVGRLKLECQGMGRLLEKSVCVSTDEYIAQKTEVERLRAALKHISEDDCKCDKINSPESVYTYTCHACVAQEALNK